jgi:hypothetical protein
MRLYLQPRPFLASVATNTESERFGQQASN